LSNPPRVSSAEINDFNFSRPNPVLSSFSKYRASGNVLQKNKKAEHLAFLFPTIKGYEPQGKPWTQDPGTRPTKLPRVDGHGFGKLDQVIFVRQSFAQAD
jgi:hypothetical protein